LRSSSDWSLGPRERVEVRLTSAPRITISIRGPRWDELRDFVRESADGLETGGYLFGQHVRGWDRRVSVARVTRMVKGRAAASVLLDTFALGQEEADIRASEADGHYGELGSWHTHPDTQNGCPSDTDLDSWLNRHGLLQRSYVGLVFTAHPSDERWARPNIHAWIVQRDAQRRNRPICERALAEVNGALRTP
jgi:hypothetical protein